MIRKLQFTFDLSDWREVSNCNSEKWRDLNSRRNIVRRYTTKTPPKSVSDSHFPNSPYLILLTWEASWDLRIFPSLTSVYGMDCVLGHNFPRVATDGRMFFKWWTKTGTYQAPVQRYSFILQPSKFTNWYEASLIILFHLHRHITSLM